MEHINRDRAILDPKTDQLHGQGDKNCTLVLQTRANTKQNVNADFFWPVNQRADLVPHGNNSESDCRDVSRELTCECVSGLSLWQDQPRVHASTNAPLAHSSLTFAIIVCLCIQFTPACVTWAVSASHDSYVCAALM